LKDKYVRHKTEMFKRLRSKGLRVQVHYIPVYLQPYYQKSGYKRGLCPAAEDFYAREISIPLYPVLSDEDVQYVADVVSKVLTEFR
jgi:dTDP-4-amino-4,6-dideoxygalactose transaminase